MDMHVIAERVAEVVNRRLAEFNKRLDMLESRIAKLELDVGTLRTQAIESIVRSILSIKLEELATAVATKVSSKYSSVGRELTMIINEFREDVSAIKGIVDELEELKTLPVKVADIVSKTEPRVELDASKIEVAVNNAVSKSLKNLDVIEKRVVALEKKIDHLSNSIGKLSESLATLASSMSKLEKIGRSVADMKESIDYVREVSSILEERLKRRPEEEEEG